jgi:hypothetical protein
MKGNNMILGKILTFKDIMNDDLLPPEAIIKDGILLDKTILADWASQERDTSA